MKGEAAHIRTQSVPTCPSCAADGDVRYADLVDRLFGAPGSWQLKRCRNRSCGLLWLDPAPVEADIARLYQTYHTHVGGKEADPNIGPGIKRVARRHIMRTIFGYDAQYSAEAVPVAAELLGRLQVMRDRVGRSIMWLPARQGGRLLDYGCGSGNFVALMRRLGWDAVGYDPDPRAADAAQRSHGIQVRTGTFETIGFEDGSFDAVTMSHVIEHLADPGRTLGQLVRLLKPGGRLVVITPNARSLGLRLLGADWRGLEPPRHLQIFSRGALDTLLQRSGLQVESVVSVAVGAGWMWQQSTRQRRSIPEAHDDDLLSLDISAMTFAWVQHLSLRFGDVGDELVAVATRPLEFRDGGERPPNRIAERRQR